MLYVPWMLLNNSMILFYSWESMCVLPKLASWRLLVLKIYPFIIITLSLQTVWGMFSLLSLIVSGSASSLGQR